MKHWTRIIIVVASISLLAAGCVKVTTTQTTILTEPTTSYTTIGLNSAAAKSANGLSFAVSTDLTTYQPGQDVQIVTDEKNTLTKTNNVRVSDDWPLNGLTRMYFGNPNPDIPYGIAVYQGDYTSTNYSTATPLNLDNPTAIYLGPPVIAPILFSFQSLSDIADIIPGNSIPGGYASSIINQQQISAEMTLKGYWTDDSVSKFTYFSPVVYTIVGGDEWGNLALVHFTVSDSITTNQPETSSQIPSEPFFPTQIVPAKAYMLALLKGGTLMIDNAGYIRIGSPNLPASSANGPLIIWPYGYSFKTEGTNIWIINDKGQTVARVGDKLDLGGGSVDASVVEVLIGYALPKDAVGPYYIAAPLQASQ